MKKTISILGSTGSIGVSTCQVVEKHPDKFKIAALAAGKNIQVLAQQIKTFEPELVSIASEEDAAQLKELLGPTKNLEIVFGLAGNCQVASYPTANLVVSAIVGAAGLAPTLAAIKAKKNIALANKETLVVAGSLVTKAARENNVAIIPVDSEHSALFQSLVGHRREDLKKIILTASGGPFRNKTAEELKTVTAKAALQHPNWEMGSKITIDSASMMNKGLEVIEAHWLFDVPAEQIDVLVHPQSIIHSMIEYKDGCVMAQLGAPDMKAPIAYALAFPERVESGVEQLDLRKISTLTFEAADTKRFPCLQLSFAAMKAGDSMPAVLNAANEIAVAAFLNEQIGFMDIATTVEKTMQAHQKISFNTLEEILAVDLWARDYSQKLIVK